MIHVCGAISAAGYIAVCMQSIYIYCTFITENAQHMHTVNLL